VKILLAYDGFDHSSNALDQAAELGRAEAARITVVSVVPEKDARASKSGGHRWLAPHAHLDVAKAHGFLREAGIDAEMKILHGDPVEELCKEAANGYDLALVGSRELGRLGELLVGSVSRRLVAEMPVPVLVVGKSVSVQHEPVA
jgi:nucleotide-binding universal stress UspA family protein